MPTVAIRNFKMPESCRSCKCMVHLEITYDELYGCVFTRKDSSHCDYRPEDCPLVEIVDEEDDLR